MKRWVIYWPLAPLVSPLVDYGETVLFSMPYVDYGISVDVAVLGEGGSLHALRVITASSTGKLSAEELRTVNAARELMLTTLRMTHDYELRLHRFGQTFLVFSNFTDEDGRPAFNVRIELNGGMQALDIAKCRATFIGNAQNPEFARLLADALQLSMPSQYRYLSLYKILELVFRQGRTWVGFDDALAPFEGDYRALSVSDKPMSVFIHAFRDRCAHIKLGKKGSWGVTGLDSADTEVVEKFLPLMLRVVVGIPGVGRPRYEVIG